MCKVDQNSAILGWYVASAYQGLAVNVRIFFKLGWCTMPYQCNGSSIIEGILI